MRHSRRQAPAPSEAPASSSAGSSCRRPAKAARPVSGQAADEVGERQDRRGPDQHEAPGPRRVAGEGRGQRHREDRAGQRPGHADQRLERGAPARAPGRPRARRRGSPTASAAAVESGRHPERVDDRPQPFGLGEERPVVGEIEHRREGLVGPGARGNERDEQQRRMRQQQERPPGSSRRRPRGNARSPGAAGTARAPARPRRRPVAARASLRWSRKRPASADRREHGRLDHRHGEVAVQAREEDLRRQNAEGAAEEVGRREGGERRQEGQQAPRRTARATAAAASRGGTSARARRRAPPPPRGTPRRAARGRRA